MFAGALIKLVNRVTTTKTAFSFTLLSMFCKCVVPAVKDRRTDTIRAANNIEARIGRWSRGEYKELWEEAVNLTVTQTATRRGRRGNMTRSQEQVNAERARKLTMVGQYSRASQALSSAGMAEQSGATIETLRSKHPTQTEEEEQQQERGDEE